MRGTAQDRDYWRAVANAALNLHYQISREKLEPEPGFEPRISKAYIMFLHLIIRFKPPCSISHEVS